MKRRRKWPGNRSGVNGKETSRHSARLRCFQAMMLWMGHIEKVFTFFLGVKAQPPNTKAPWAGARQEASLLTSRGQKGAQTSCLATVVMPDFEPLTRRLVPVQWYCIQVSSHPGAQESLTAGHLTQAVTMYHQLYP